METDDLDQILAKSYGELSVAEKEAIQDICGSEEEFIHLQQVFASVENYARETIENSTPSRQTKEKLDDLFYETYQSKGILWYNSLWTTLYPAEKRFDQRPLVRIAAILILFVSVIPLFNNPKIETPALATNKKIESSEKESVPSDVKKNMESGNENLSEQSGHAQMEMIQSADDATVPYFAAPAESRKDMITGNYFESRAMDQAESMDFFSAPTAEKAAFSVDRSTAKYADGIYMDTFTLDPAAFSVKQNLAVLDLLTPAF